MIHAKIYLFGLMFLDLVAGGGQPMEVDGSAYVLPAAGADGSSILMLEDPLHVPVLEWSNPSGRCEYQRPGEDPEECDATRGAILLAALPDGVEPDWDLEPEYGPPIESDQPLEIRLRWCPCRTAESLPLWERAWRWLFPEAICSCADDRPDVAGELPNLAGAALRSRWKGPQGSDGLNPKYPTDTTSLTDGGWKSTGPTAQQLDFGPLDHVLSLQDVGPHGATLNPDCFPYTESCPVPLVARIPLEIGELSVCQPTGLEFVGEAEASVAKFIFADPRPGDVPSFRRPHAHAAAEVLQLTVSEPSTRPQPRAGVLEIRIESEDESAVVRLSTRTDSPPRVSLSNPYFKKAESLSLGAAYHFDRFYGFLENVPEIRPVHALVKSRGTMPMDVFGCDPVVESSVRETAIGWVEVDLPGAVDPTLENVPGTTSADGDSSASQPTASDEEVSPRTGEAAGDVAGFSLEELRGLTEEQRIRLREIVVRPNWPTLRVQDLRGLKPPPDFEPLPGVVPPVVDGVPISGASRPICPFVRR